MQAKALSPQLDVARGIRHGGFEDGCVPPAIPTRVAHEMWCNNGGSQHEPDRYEQTHLAAQPVRGVTRKRGSSTRRYSSVGGGRGASGISTSESQMRTAASARLLIHETAGGLGTKMCVTTPLGMTEAVALTRAAPTPP
jgi:hypothetical protein